MALVFADRIKETTDATSGDINLTGASLGYKTFQSTLTDGDTMYYCIADDTYGTWEIGLGTYVYASNSITRDTVYSNSNNNTNLVTFNSGQKVVFITQPTVFIEQLQSVLPSSYTISNISNASTDTITIATKSFTHTKIGQVSTVTFSCVYPVLTLPSDNASLIMNTSTLDASLFAKANYIANGFFINNSNNNMTAINFKLNTTYDNGVYTTMIYPIDYNGDAILNSTISDSTLNFSFTFTE